MALMPTTEKDDSFLDEEVTAPTPFQNVDWEDLVEDDVPITKPQPAKEEIKKRKRFVSKYHISPFMDPCAKRVNPSQAGSGTQVEEEEKLFNELKTWVKGLATEEPICVTLDLSVCITVDRKFFRDLIDPSEWLSSVHIDALSNMLKSQRVEGQQSELVSLYFVNQLMRKKLDKPADWNGDRLLKRIDWRGLSKVFIPLNVEDKHWILCEVNLEEVVVKVYGSLKSSRTPWYACQLCMSLPYLLQHIQHGLPRPLHLRTWEAVAVDEVPQQAMGSGVCGVMVMAFAEHLLHGLPLTPGCEYDNTPTIRKNFALRLYRLRKHAYNIELKNE
ncbi:unnamed protein product [Cuscuta europaea]|uniref:Ubiquitin-like protease family profile domain-containing protein n=1 Tax=Cuscuta europaea TaxID=41803 RepID=A0A9P0ZTH5_CUSEU|nr:unnamed protein product [Cuscuta europaea]